MYPYGNNFHVNNPKRQYYYRTGTLWVNIRSWFARDQLLAICETATIYNIQNSQLYIAQKGRLSLPAGIAGNDAHDLIMIERLADEGGDQPLLEDPFNGRIIRVEVAGNDDDRQMGIGFTELPGQLETIDVRKFGV